MTRTVSINNIAIGGNNPLALIAGPCVIEDVEVTLSIARTLKEIAASLSIPYIFKTSYDKANRSSLQSYRGPGLEKGLEVIQMVKKVSGIDFDVIESPRRLGDPPELIAGNELIQQVFDWTPQHQDLELLCRTASEWDQTWAEIQRNQ